MARNAALNPASTPFFPGGSRNKEDESVAGLGFGHPIISRDREPSVSLHSISFSEYRSAKSSPSPPHEGQVQENGLQPSAKNIQALGSRQASQNQRHDLYFPQEIRPVKDANLPNIDVFPRGTDPPGLASDARLSGESMSFFPDAQFGRRDKLDTPAVSHNQPSSRSSSFNTGGPFPSSSPVSSLDSASQIAPGSDQILNFDAQLRASPLIHEILDRLVLCEYTTREIQRDLSDVHRKVDFLVERSAGNGLQPDFKDPFAPNSVGSSFAGSLNASAGRGSVGPIAPNQSPPSDDIVHISQRLNTLTSSVGQLLALQTQQHIQSVSANLPTSQGLGPISAQNDVAPNQMSASPLSSNTPFLGHGLPNRPDVRASSRTPNPPMRTWSAGTLDLPVRNIESRNESVIRDKRRSIIGIVRRDSTGVSEIHSDGWTGGTARDGGPVVSKWEQLSLSSELLRSLNKFGIGPPNKIQQRALPFLLRGADIIAQAPPTQERIAAYVIPAIQIAVTNTVGRSPNRGPVVIMISTTVDQATQAQRMIRDLGGPIGIRSALGVGTTSGNGDVSQELRLLHQNMPHIICGTPQKLHALFTSPGGMSGSEVRFLVLDEVDQLIARNLHEYVFNIVKLLPPPRSRSLSNNIASIPGAIGQSPLSSYESNVVGATTAFQSSSPRFPGLSSSPTSMDSVNNTTQTIERQTALFSNTVPQDVLNLASAIQLREPVRVLVRRDGNVTHADGGQTSRGLRQFYLYLAFTAGGRSDSTTSAPGGGLGIIGSGRGSSSAESAQAREWKLDALADLFDDIEVNQAIVHVGGMTSLDAVVYKLASRGLEAVPLHSDMTAGAKLAALNKFRSSSSVYMRQSTTKILVVYDVPVKTTDISHVPLIINYDLPKAVEEYAQRVASAIASNYARPGIVVNFVTATGGDVEMLRSIECFYKIKCPEVPMSLRDIL